MKPPPSPGPLRSSRKRALEIGTNPSGFPDSLPQDLDGGFPVEAPGQGGTYQGRVPQIEPTNPAPAQPPHPFKLR